MRKGQVTPQGAKYGTDYMIFDGRVRPLVAGGDGDEGASPLVALTAQVEQAEGDLSALTATQVAELRDAIYAGYQTARPTVQAGDVTGTAALTRLAAALGILDAHLATPEVAAALTAEQAAAEQALADLDAAVAPRASAEGDAGDAGAAAGGDAGDAGAGGDAGAAGGDAGDAGAAGGGDAGGGDAAPPAGGDAGGGEDAAAAEARRVAAARAARNRPSLGALEDAFAGQGAGGGDDEGRFALAQPRIVAAAGASDIVPGANFSLEAIGASLQMQHGAMQTLTDVSQLDPESVYQRTHKDGRTRPHGHGGRKNYIGVVQLAQRPGVVVGPAQGTSDAGGSELIDQATREFYAHRDAMDTLNARRVASGGDCVIAQPDFSINVLGDTGTCFTDSMPTVATARPLTYYPWLEIDQSNGASGPGSKTLAEEGIGFVTSAQDAAGYGDPNADPDSTVPDGGAPFKTAVHIDCPDDPLTCTNEAVYRSMTIGNFQAQSHPEYVDAFQKYMDIWLDIERDNRALGKFIAHATTAGHVFQQNEATFGAISSLKDMFNRFVAAERSAHHAPNLSFNVVGPDWFGGYLATDALRHTFGSLDNLKTTPAGALSLASTDGIRYSTYCTEAGPTTGSGAQRMVFAPVTNAVPTWPTRARLLVYPDGAMFKKTGAELRFGLRETLLQTNDFGMFMELFENVCFRTNRVWVIDVKLCQNGATGAPVALSC